jgi:hypothetical protein
MPHFSAIGILAKRAALRPDAKGADYRLPARCAWRRGVAAR